MSHLADLGRQHQLSEVPDGSWWHGVRFGEVVPNFHWVLFFFVLMVSQKSWLLCVFRDPTRCLGYSLSKRNQGFLGFLINGKESQRVKVMKVNWLSWRAQSTGVVVEQFRILDTSDGLAPPKVRDVSVKKSPNDFPNGKFWSFSKMWSKNGAEPSGPRSLCSFIRVGEFFGTFGMGFHGSVTSGRCLVMSKRAKDGHFPY